MVVHDSTETWSGYVKEAVGISSTHKKLVIASEDGRPFVYGPGQYLRAEGGLKSGCLPIANWSDTEAECEVVCALSEEGSFGSQVAERDKVMFRGPLGNTVPVDVFRGNDVVFLVSHEGVVPARSLMHYLLAHRNDFGKIILLYGAPKPAGILFKSELEAWKKSSNMEVKVAVERGGEGWMGYVGVPTMFIPRLNVDPGKTAVFLAGPSHTYKFMVLALRSIQIPAERTALMISERMEMDEPAIILGTDYPV